MKPPITAAKLRISLKNTRRSATLRNPDPVPLVILALAADAAASAASHDFVLGRGVRAQERVGDLIGGLSDVPAAAAAALANPRALAWSFYTPAIALRLARASALGIHLRCHGAFQDGRQMRPQPPARELLDGLARFERRQSAYLRALRRAALDRKFDAPLQLAAAATADAHSELASLCTLAGRAADSGDPRSAEVALRASDLARRHAALVAGAILIDNRLRNRRQAKSTADAAARAPELRRKPARPSAARTTLRASDHGKRVAIVGRLGVVDFIERPQKPYSRALISGTWELRVPHKNMRRAGVVSGAWVWAAGKVKAIDHRTVLEVEFEGPGQNARQFFEDWVFDQARHAYDLYPSVLRMVWEFPNPRTRGGAADIYSRLTYRSEGR